MTIFNKGCKLTSIIEEIKVYLSDPNDESLHQVLQTCRQNHEVINFGTIYVGTNPLVMDAQANDMATV